MTMDGPCVIESAGDPPDANDASVDAEMLAWKTGHDPEPVGRPAGTDLLPSPSKWQQMVDMAPHLAKSGLIRARGYGRPEDVLVILLAAHDLGIASTLAIQKIHVIDGKPSPSAELMAGLVMREGHEIWPEESTATRAVACARRVGSERIGRVEWTIDMARNAGLANKDNWKKYPAAMLWARAVSQLCRMMFADVLAGLTYTPDELGAIEDGDGNVIDAPGYETAVDEPIDAETRDAFRTRAATLPDALRAELNATWRAATARGNLRRFEDLRSSDAPKVDALIGQYERKATTHDATDVDDAEIVTVDVMPASTGIVCETCGFGDGDHDTECPDRPM